MKSADIEVRGDEGVVFFEDEIVVRNPHDSRSVNALQLPFAKHLSTSKEEDLPVMKKSASFGDFSANLLKSKIIW